MTSRAVSCLALGVVIGLAGCGPSRGAAKAVKSAATSKAKPAAAGAMCKEHGVLEVVCTQCQPKLIAIFKAKGDWCSEHGFPESFCPTCHPEAGGKPLADVAADGAPMDGFKIRFKSKETAALAGFRYARAVELPNGPGVAAAVTIAFDATRVGLVNARSAGVVRRLAADIGTVVQPGAVLAVLESGEVGAARSRLLAAQSRVGTARVTWQREQSLQASGISSSAEVQLARQERDAAQAELAALRAELDVVGKAHGAAGTYAVTSPLAGTVTQRHVNIGQFVTQEDALFQVVDASSVWALIDVPELDLPQVATGQDAIVQIDGLGERPFRGTVRFVPSEIDKRTRTAQVRVVLANADGALRANQFGSARIQTGASQPTVLIPRASVQKADGIAFAFVRLAADTFETKRLRLGPGQGDKVVVLAGLKRGDEVVTDGSFLLKTETLKDSIGAGCDCVAE